MLPAPASLNPPFRWADRLLVAGLGLAVLTIIPGVGLLTIFIVPCCFYLSWVLYVAAWPARPLSGGEWARVVLSALAAHLVLAWMLQGGYVKSGLVCGAELLLALAWQWWRQGRGHGGARRAVVVGLWVLAAGLGLRAGDLFKAVSTQDALWTRAMLLAGADANARETGFSVSKGQPALYQALSAFEPDAEIVGLLLHYGADPNGGWVDENGNLIRSVAFALTGHERAQLQKPVLRLLLQAGLNPCRPERPVGADQPGQHLRAALTAFGPTIIADSVALAEAERRCGCR